MGVGRFACVALPFALTLASLICLLIAGLSGLADKNLPMFTVDTKNLSISSSSLTNLFDELTKRDELVARQHFSDLTNAALNGAIAAAGGSNITASELGLADKYDVSLWGYCSETGSTRNCTKGKFNWASSTLNTTSLDTLTGAASAIGANVTFPKEVTDSLKTFAEVNKWTEVVYIIAMIATAVELVLGIFAICSRVGSCFAWIISGISTAASLAASIMATAMSATAVGALLSTSKAYGVKGSLDTGFLAATWLAVAFSIASGLCWAFTICCCASNHSSRNNRRSRAGDSEKLIPTGSYQPVEDSHFNNPSTAYRGGYSPQQPQRATNGAYEPYSHAAV
ncbi:hypothetical protein B7494_g527 [Chlorociboria aeruginascens]|nr:hypothetical protein B7494_g527 [Chlorociboria aeruginascens]